MAGVGFAPIAQSGFAPVAGAFGYIPVSWSPLGDGYVLHANAGFVWEHGTHDHDGEQHVHRGLAATWAVRSDVLLPFTAGRVKAIAELFGEDRYSPELQLGVPRRSCLTG